MRLFLPLVKSPVSPVSTGFRAPSHNYATNRPRQFFGVEKGWTLCNCNTMSTPNKRANPYVALDTVMEHFLLLPTI